MSTDQDQARLIAERVARRVAGAHSEASPSGDSTARAKNGAPVSEDWPSPHRLSGHRFLRPLTRRSEIRKHHRSLFLLLIRRGYGTSTARPIIPARNALVSKKRPWLSWWSFSKTKRSAQSNQAESRAIIARCAARAGSRFKLLPGYGRTVKS